MLEALSGSARGHLHGISFDGWACHFVAESRYLKYFAKSIHIANKSGSYKFIYRFCPNGAGTVVGVIHLPATGGDLYTGERSPP
ncbi:hypothetical protein LDDCCGHA_3663 [Methylobacterium oxalidis]|nr:hypothetical protein LDDCCGHA_3663 [Methylobacterium oxalidis]